MSSVNFRKVVARYLKVVAQFFSFPCVNFTYFSTGKRRFLKNLACTNLNFAQKSGFLSVIYSIILVSNNNITQFIFLKVLCTRLFLALISINYAYFSVDPTPFKFTVSFWANCCSLFNSVSYLNVHLFASVCLKNERPEFVFCCRGK